MTTGIYAIKNTANGKIYIGSACDIERRWKVHRSDLSLGRHHSKPLQRAWKKYGPDAFAWIVLEIVESIDVLIDREQDWIDGAECCAPRGYNLAPIAGSCRGTKWSIESRQRRVEQAKRIGVSDACRRAQREVMTPERLREMQRKAVESRYRNGKARVKKTWPNTPENRKAHIAALAERSRGKPLSEMHRAKISASQKGRPGRVWTDSEKAKVSASSRGRQVSDETRERLRAAWVRRRMKNGDRGQQTR